MYDPPTTVPYRDGCVLGGNDPASGGLVTRLSGDGSVEWEHTLSDPDVSVSDLVVTPSDDITGIAENESTRNSFDVFTLRGDGERTMRRRLEVEPGTNIHDPQLVLDPAGGYVCAFTYAEKEGVFVGKLSTDGELETARTSLHGGRSPVRPPVLPISTTWNSLRTSWSVSASARPATRTRGTRGLSDWRGE